MSYIAKTGFELLAVWLIDCVEQLDGFLLSTHLKACAIQMIVERYLQYFPTDFPKYDRGSHPFLILKALIKIVEKPTLVSSLSATLCSIAVLEMTIHSERYLNFFSSLKERQITAFDERAILGREHYAIAALAYALDWRIDIRYRTKSNSIALRFEYPQERSMTQPATVTLDYMDEARCEIRVSSRSWHGSCHGDFFCLPREMCVHLQSIWDETDIWGRVEQNIQAMRAQYDMTTQWLKQQIQQGLVDVDALRLAYLQGITASARLPLITTAHTLDDGSIFSHASSDELCDAFMSGDYNAYMMQRLIHAVTTQIVLGAIQSGDIPCSSIQSS